MSFQSASPNRFLSDLPGRLFVVNALPMMVVMTMNGLLTVVDAVFLGRVVGADALAAVSLVFPVLMILTALSTLVGGGMSSLLARHLGAGDRDAAEAVLAGAHGLALFLSLVLIAAFAAGGNALVQSLAGAQPGIAGMAWSYLAIMILAAPVQLLLTVHADAWRNEGRAGLMALLSLGVTLANIALDYLLIVELRLGVAGSAWGTAAAQALGLLILAGLRLRGGGMLPMAALARHSWLRGWRGLLALGAPVSLSFIGIALVSATVIAVLRLTAGEGYADMVAAYGIVTRIFSFAFLPLMAMGLATQSIVGNNIGAGLYDRSRAVLRIALTVALLYCLCVELVLQTGGGALGGLFVTAPGVIAGVAQILRPMVALYLFTGPVLVLALSFQAAGRPGRTAALTLVKPFLLAPALVATLGALGGVGAIWLAFPLADGIVVLIAALILARDQGGAGFGLSGQEASS